MGHLEPCSADRRSRNAVKADAGSRDDLLLPGSDGCDVVACREIATGLQILCKINLIQYDDAYSPPKAVEQVRKLVESDEVLLTFQVLGTPSNAAVQKYLNSRKVPQLFAAASASRFSDPKNFRGP